MTLRSSIPIDEGEAEAQPDLPVVTVRLLDPPDGGFPRQVRFEVGAWAGKQTVITALVRAHAETWLDQSGCTWDDTEPKPEWTDTEDGRARTLTYTLTGWV